MFTSTPLNTLITLIIFFFSLLVFEKQLNEEFMKKILLLSLIILLQSCGKKTPPSEEAIRNSSIESKTDPKVIKDVDNSTKDISLTSDENFFITLATRALYERLIVDKIYYSNNYEGMVETDICKYYKETYRKLEIDGYTMIITDVSEYVSIPKNGVDYKLCVKRDFDKTTYVKKGIFDEVNLKKELSAIYLKNKEFYIKKGFDFFELKPTGLSEGSYGDSTKFEISVSRSTDNKYDWTWFLDIHHEISFKSTTMTISDNNQTMVVSNHFRRHGTNSVEQYKFHELAFSNGTKEEDSLKYIAIFNKTLPH